jgi:glycosyltransferase involved in cell wall biosynthesis
MLEIGNSEIWGVSVIIVTYNGKERIQRTLECLLKQVNINFPCELIVVDNNSSDGTVDLVRSYWNDSDTKIRIRILFETEQGNAPARRLGISSSKYRYILFCDDDNSLRVNYIWKAFKYISSNNEIAAVGGRGLPIYSAENFRPWMTEQFRFLGCGAQGSDGDVTRTKGCLYSAGMILDKKWLEVIVEKGYKPRLSGRKGNSYFGGEDTELTYELARSGGKLYYYGDLMFDHFIDERRLSWSYFKKLHFGLGYTDYILSLKRKSSSSMTIELLYSLKCLFFNYIFSFYQCSREGNTRILLCNRYMGRFIAILNNRFYDI